MCEPSGNFIRRNQHIEINGNLAVENAESGTEWLTSTDERFRPVNLFNGPSGGLYIVDMYREIIEDYSAVPRFLQQQYGLNKGKEYGRIWRLRPKGKVLALKGNLAKATVKELAQALADDNPWRRSTAQRVLLERNDRGGRDHWSNAMSVMFAGGGTPGVK